MVWGSVRISVQICFISGTSGLAMANLKCNTSLLERWRQEYGASDKRKWGLSC